ncbi:MAG TPA: hypothetical protein DCQ06_12590 [Myxococcales bacterium]|nr:hypothetical protein [Myxococcales bacterium]|tara:strand:- start:1290 stop:1829 length:540 start_codon:yes stop_codon:yes gene_type:complete
MISRRRGTVLARILGQTVQRPRDGLVIALLLMLWPACVVLPELEEPPVVDPAVNILDEKVDPPMLQPIIVPRSEPIRQFTVEQAVFSAGLAGSLNYQWYYDYDAAKTIPLPYFALCGDSPKCILAVCTKPESNADDHRLLLVVSDRKLASDAQSPFDFPKGAVFDSVQWQLKLTDSCPE